MAETGACARAAKAVIFAINTARSPAALQQPSSAEPSTSRATPAALSPSLTSPEAPLEKLLTSLGLGAHYPTFRDVLGATLVGDLEFVDDKMLASNLKLLPVELAKIRSAMRSCGRSGSADE